jgi:Cu+-exporting ATPase
VFAVIASAGLDGVYRCATGRPASQRTAHELEPDRFAVLDDADVQRRFIDASGSEETVATFTLPALHCASCVWLLERLYRVDAGIVRSEVDLLRRTIRVAYSPARTTLRRVAEALASVGYDPLVDPERSAGGVPRARRRLYLKIGVAGFAFGNVMLFSIPRYANGAPLEPQFQRLFDALNLALAVPVLVFSASDYFRTACRALRARTMLLDVPVALGLAALFGRSVADILSGRGEGFLDSFAGLVFFLLIGRLFQQKAFEGMAFDRTVRSFLPLTVGIEAGGAIQRTPLDEVRPGDVLVLRPGEVVPADSVLRDAAATLDYAFVSGESAPRALRAGEEAPAGGRIVGQAVRLQVIRPVSHSRLAELWTRPVFARTKPHWITTVSSRFAWHFTVGAIGLALAGAVLWWPDAAMSLQVATAVLIVACPCALTLAAPVALGTAMGQLGRFGCYLKQPDVVLDLARVSTVAFDKTGTLTLGGGDSVVRHDLPPEHWDAVRRLAAESVHPISRAIAASAPVVAGAVSDVHEQTGLGITGFVNGERVVLGRSSFVGRETGRVLPDRDDHTWAAVGPDAPRPIVVRPAERRRMASAISDLRRRYRICLLSGDAPRDARRWSRLFGGQVRFRLSPDTKLDAVRARQAGGERVLMVGDGLNDAGALAAAEVGFAVSDDTACLVPACDGVIRGDRLPALAGVLSYARLARRVITIAFAVSVAYNAIGIALALAGRLTPLATAILMPVSSLTVIGLSAGLMRFGARRVAS